MPKPKWLGRTLMLGPNLTLCTSEEELEAVRKQLKVADDHPFTNPKASATLHSYSNNESHVCIVCIKPVECLEDALSLLVHEAVHVWQEHCLDIGDDNPSDEAAAYGIQAIAHALICEYMEREA